MKNYYRSFLTLLLLFGAANLFAQNKPATHTDSLMHEGIALNDAGKYTEALAKYDEVLKTYPESRTALYEKALTLSTMGKNDDAIVIFEKLVSILHSAEAYAGLANAYDMKGDSKKAIEYYKQGIARWPKDRNLWFNLCVSYARQKNYVQSELAAAEAIKADPKHLRSYQNYAVAAYQQGRNAEALLGLSNLLMFGSNSRSLASCQIIKDILHATPGNNADPIAKMQQETIAQAVASSTSGKTNLTSIDSLTLQLTATYKAIKAQEDQYGSPFFSKYFGTYFGDIAASNYMDVYTRFIGVSLAPQENLAWLKTHPDDIKAFNTWLSTEKRDVE